MSKALIHLVVGFVGLSTLIAIVLLPNWTSCSNTQDWYQGLLGWSYDGFEHDKFYNFMTESGFNMARLTGQDIPLYFMFFVDIVFMFIGFIIAACGIGSRSHCVKTTGIVFGSFGGECLTSAASQGLVALALFLTMLC